MRVDSLARGLSRRVGRVSHAPAIELWRRQDSIFKLTGAEAAARYGLMAHYTRKPLADLMRQGGSIGLDAGCWLTPTPYSACMAPYDLGLNDPRDSVLIVDVTGLNELWGPGTALPSQRYHSIWQGGGMEFYCPSPIPFLNVVAVQDLEPCGDQHR